MATSGGVSFGTLTTTNGVPRFSGGSSQIDTAGLVEALTQAKRIPAVRLESKISLNEAKQAAYGEFRTLLRGLQDAVAGLRNPPGVLGLQQNLFEAKEVFYSANTATSPATLLTVSAGNKVPPGKLEVIVEQIATAQKLSGEAFTGSADLATVANGGTAFAGSLTLGLAGGSTKSIDVDGTMSVLDLKGAINAVSSTTGVTASVINVAADDVRLVLTAEETGREITLASAGGDDVLGLLGLSYDGGATPADELVEAKGARVRIDGVPVTRSSNQMTDVIDGISLNLFKAEPGTKVTVEVERSLGGVQQQIQSFVDAYNAVRDFAARQFAVSETGEVAAEAVLFGDSVLRTLTQSLGTQLTNPVAGLANGAPNSLASLGLTLDAGNRLRLDAAKLDSKLLSDIDAVRNVFEFRFNASSAELAVFARTNDLADPSFTLSIVDADQDGVPESATADGVALDVVDGQLTGRAGTAYAGLELLWTGKGSTNIDVTATQGVADRLYNLIDGAVDEFQGMLTKAVDDLGERNTDYRAEIEQVETRAERYRQQLIERFGAMETALSLSKAMLEQIRVSVAAYTQGS